MIAKEVNYDLAIDEWKALLDRSSLTQAQQRMARFHLAGLHAEKDMAYHLKVFFAERPEFQVFNNLMVSHNGLSAQIDHLVLTRWTAYFIESKSVSQIITVNEHGEWGRIHNRRFTPMESPVEQSRRHQQILYDFMTAHREQFMGKLLGLKLKYFHRLLTPLHYVAISSQGQIRGSGRRQCEEVMKADQVAHTIQAYHEELNTGILYVLHVDKDTEAFSKTEFADAVAFLLGNDVAPTPLTIAHQMIDQIDQEASKFSASEREASKTELDESPTARLAARKHTCKHCRSQDLIAAHGPYGYYLKCKSCDRNNAIVELCEACKLKIKVTKAGPALVGICPGCQASRVVWQEPVQEPAKAPTAPPSPVGIPQTAQEPRCPVCKSEMKLRTARSGKNQGQHFWGCTKYPGCRGIVQS